MVSTSAGLDASTLELRLKSQKNFIQSRPRYGAEARAGSSGAAACGNAGPASRGRRAVKYPNK
jgi:hypothetical protein